ncbi:Na-translocating system protein MpsC family protein [Kitasatospora aureofaciens]
METNVQRDLSSYIGRVLRDHFGKGPESVFVTLGHTFITCYLRNFLSPMERVLLEQDQIVTNSWQTRDLLMKNLLPEITAYLKIATGVEIGKFITIGAYITDRVSLSRLLRSRCRTQAKLRKRLR